MAYRYGDRYQMGFLPQSIEDYVDKNNPVRVYDAFVDALDFGEMGIVVDSSKVGNSEYDPKAMMKLLIFGYSYGIRSSRKLERECYNNISFIWLVGGLRPDHKTIAEFRRKNKSALKQILRQSVQICLKLDLIAGNVLFVDGTKSRANASLKQTHNRGYYEKQLSKIDERITKLLMECESVDEEEEGLGSYVKMSEDLANTRDLRSKIEEILEVFEETGRKSVNQTDPDCAVMRSVQGSHASYNIQNVVDDKHSLIVHSEAVNDTSDVNQFAVQVNQANKETGKLCDTACADAGYADTTELEKIDNQGIKVVVPSQRQALHKEEGDFSKSHFTYNKEKDCYYCPEGRELKYQTTDKQTGKRQYKIKNKLHCLSCKNYGQCTKAKTGRKIVRLHNEESKLRFEKLYEDSQEIYKKRKSKVEHPFGHIKRNLKFDAFLMRGKEGVQAETSILTSCFNIARMTTIFGISTLLTKLASLSATAV
jgi:transposase